MYRELTVFAVYVGAMVVVIALVPAARLGLTLGLAMGLAVAMLSTVHAARYRLPTEGWAHWYRRIMFTKREKSWEYHYCLLECGHYGQIRSSRAPRRDDVVWCPAHHRTRAEQTRVALVNSHAGHGVKTVTGVALDDDLLEGW